MIEFSEIFAPAVIEHEIGTIQYRQNIRAKIIRLEAHLMTMDSEQLEIETKHHFSNGIYAREVFIPKGTLLTGKIHKTEHLNILSKGDVSVLTEFGPERIVAHNTFISQPWTKRVVYAHEDSIWTVLHATNAKTPDEAEEILIAKNYDELEKIESLLLEEKGE